MGASDLAGCFGTSASSWRFFRPRLFTRLRFFCFFKKSGIGEGWKWNQANNSRYSRYLYIWYINKYIYIYINIYLLMMYVCQMLNGAGLFTYICWVVVWVNVGCQYMTHWSSGNCIYISICDLKNTHIYIYICVCDINIYIYIKNIYMCDINIYIYIYLNIYIYTQPKTNMDTPKRKRIKTQPTALILGGSFQLFVFGCDFFAPNTTLVGVNSLGWAK